MIPVAASLALALAAWLRLRRRPRRGAYRLIVCLRPLANARKDARP